MEWEYRNNSSPVHWISAAFIEHQENDLKDCWVADSQWSNYSSTHWVHVRAYPEIPCVLEILHVADTKLFLPTPLLFQYWSVILLCLIYSLFRSTLILMYFLSLWWAQLNICVWFCMWSQFTLNWCHLLFITDRMLSNSCLFSTPCFMQYPYVTLYCQCSQRITSTHENEGLQTWGRDSSFIGPLHFTHQ